MFDCRYTQIRKRGKGKKVYLRMVTTLGNLSLMLHFDIVSRGALSRLIAWPGLMWPRFHSRQVPRTTHNFVELCKQKYYNGVKLHRLIAGFMVRPWLRGRQLLFPHLRALVVRVHAAQVQGGDPTGTGHGGKSAWGGNFRDVSSTAPR